MMTKNDASELVSAFLKKERISLNPQLHWIARDDGTFSTKVSIMVNYLPEEQVEVKEEVIKEVVEDPKKK